MSADTRTLIDDLSRALDRRMITVEETTTYIGVTKSCLYAWKRGAWNPHGDKKARLAALVAFLRKTGL